jgi:tetratricopeptide (TPR) repeat protein
MHRLLCALLVLLALMVASPAHATDAEQLFVDGQSKFDAKKYDEALELFSKALEETGSPNARLYVARCLRELERNARAYDEMRTTVRSATRLAKKEERYVQTRDAAAAELAVLEQRVGRLSVAFSGKPDDPTLWVNDERIDRARWEMPIAVEPGGSKVRAEDAAGRTITKVIEVKAGESRALALNFDQPVEAPIDEPEEPEEPDTDTTEGGSVRIAGYVVLGLGIAGLAAFGITEAMAASEFSSLEDACGTARCTDPAQADTVDRGKTLETVARISAVGGGVLAVAGITMIVVGGPEESDSAASLRIGPDGGMVGYRLRF